MHRSQVNQEVAERVYAHASKGELTVTLGGDHSLVRRFLYSISFVFLLPSFLDADMGLQAMGTVTGTFKAHPDAALIWVDAHAVSRPTDSLRRAQCPTSLVTWLTQRTRWLVGMRLLTGHQHAAHDPLGEPARLPRLVPDGLARHEQGRDPRVCVDRAGLEVEPVGLHRVARH